MPSLDEFDEGYERQENDTIRSYNFLASLMECGEMQSIIEIFVEKIVQNLIFSDGTTNEGKQVIEFTLETFDSFVSAPSSCRLLCKSPMIK